jgi:hypothetical protein
MPDNVEELLADVVAAAYPTISASAPVTPY